MKYEDDELIFMVKESDNDAKDILLNKYSYIIDILMKKYRKVAYALNINQEDLYQEAMMGFVEAINGYQGNKDASLARFITICVDRKLINALNKARTIKNKVMLDTLSLEYASEENNKPLMDILGDNNKNNPLIKIESEEQYLELLNKIKTNLSDFENEVFHLLISGLDYNEIAIILDKDSKQIDNTIQRIKLKVKKLLNI